MEPRKRILLITSLLGGGGAERVLLTMAKWWEEQGSDVAILVLRNDVNVRDYAVPARVAVRRLNLIGERNPWWSPAQVTRLLRLRRAVRESGPDVVVSFIDKLNVAVLLALSGTGIPVVATEHLAPWMNPLGAFWEGLRRLAYRRATAIVSPTKRITDWFQARMGGNFVTLPYPAQIEIRERRERKRRAVVLGVGRLARQKGFDVLIEAFGRIAARFPGWSVEIAGEGPERGALTEQIRRAGLGERVRLLGHVPDIAARLDEAAIFVLPSRHEAFPMVLCEAMAAGCCVVAADCPTGPQEIFAMAGEEVGLLVPAQDAGELGNALKGAMADPTRAEKLGEAAMRYASGLGAEAVMTKWAALMKTLLVATK
jgi:GalNAc-alpha-(1->4)-GalNAc-alpha-(1->3)-diNAcBac-PP-undecaprenol alpha-1,4-N-acetyl-D-galactosaminyltransferase